MLSKPQNARAQALLGCALLKRMLHSELLSQTSATAESSLEIQCINSQKIVELSQTIASIKDISHDASRVSAQISDILGLIRDSTVSTSRIRHLTDSVDTLTLKAQG